VRESDGQGAALILSEETLVDDQAKDSSSAPAAGPAPDAGAPTVPCPLGHLLGYFLRLGNYGFGGATLVGLALAR
jgi:hypothetical protein